jgi:hypothetical protein
MVMRLIATFLGMVVFFVGPALAEEIRFCTDAKKVGFDWRNQQDGKPVLFKTERFTVTDKTGRGRKLYILKDRGSGSKWDCNTLKYFQGLHCRDTPDLRGAISTSRTIIFGNEGGYTRSFLYGPPVGHSTDPYVYVAHGTCKDFKPKNWAPFKKPGAWRGYDKNGNPK